MLMMFTTPDEYIRNLAYHNDKQKTMTKTKTETITIGGTEIEFYPNSHQYKIKGRRVPNISTVSKMFDTNEALLQWSANVTADTIMEKMELNDMTPKVDTVTVPFPVMKAEIDNAKKQYIKDRNEAAKIGTEIHDYIEHALSGKGEQVELTTDESKNAIKAFEKWREDYPVSVVANEQVVLGQNDNGDIFVGRYDTLAENDGKNIMIDFKSSGDVYPSHLIQGSAYAHAAPEDVDEVWVVQLQKENKVDKETGEILRKAGEYRLCIINKEQIQEIYEQCFLPALTAYSGLKKAKYAITNGLQ